MTTWQVHKMWAIVTKDNLGNISNRIVEVYDDRKDAELHQKELENRAYEFVGANVELNLWSVIPVNVKLNQKNFRETTKKEKKEFLL